MTFGRGGPIDNVCDSIFLQGLVVNRCRLSLFAKGEGGE